MVKIHAPATLALGKEPRALNTVRILYRREKYLSLVFQYVKINNSRYIDNKRRNLPLTYTYRSTRKHTNA
jgi:hypothetical protein